VSFDIFLQSFRASHARVGGDAEAAVRVLERYLAGVPAGGFAHASTPDGGADVYGLGGDGLMINHASGESIWQVLVDVAVAGDYVIMPTGCPVCIVRPEMSSDLPEALRADAVVVRSGADVLSVLANA
jgi:hypothetical protein